MTRNAPDSQARWDARLAAEGLRPVDDGLGRVRQNPLRQQTVSEDTQRRLLALADILVDGCSDEGELPEGVMALVRRRWRYACGDARIARWIAGGGRPVDLQRAQHRRSKPVYERVARVLALAAAVSLRVTYGVPMDAREQRGADILELFVDGQWRTAGVRLGRGLEQDEAVPKNKPYRKTWPG